MKKWIIIGAIVLVVILIYSSISGSYNKMVQKDEAVKGQWGNVENVYQRRSDLIPNLVSTVKGYADFEQKTLTDVIEARSKATQVKISPENLNKESFILRDFPVRRTHKHIRRINLFKRNLRAKNIIQ